MHLLNQKLEKTLLRKCFCERNRALLGSMLAMVLLPFPVQAEMIEHSAHSPILGRMWEYRVYLPVSYSKAADATYPLLVLLHGKGGDETDWDISYPRLDALIEQGEIAPLIAVAPASGTSWWVDGVERFEKAFFSDLIPDIRARYPVRNNRDAWVIAGFSMGGYGALRYALAHPENFAGAILLSPAVYAKQPPAGSSARSSGAFGKPFDSDLWTSLNYSALLSGYVKKQLPVHLFIAAGDDEWDHPEGWEFDVEVQATRLYSSLTAERGISGELRIADGRHDWPLWIPLFEDGLRSMAAELAPFRSTTP